MLRELSDIYHLGLFDNLTPQETEEILKSIRPSHFKQGEYLFNTGEKADCLYLLKSGLVKISYVTADGNERILDIFQPGDIFGELFLGKYRHRIGEALALKDVTVFKLQENELYRLIENHPAIGFNFIRHLVDEQREILARMHALLRADARTRLLATLLSLARHHNEGDEELFTLDSSITQEDIANITGLNRSTVSSLINKFRREGLLGGTGRNLTIDYEAIETILEECGSELLE